MVRARIVLGWILVSAACTPPATVPDDADGSTSEASGSTSLGATSLGATSASMPTTTADGADTSASDPGTAATSEDTAPACAELPLGSPCEDPCECASGQCYQDGGLGGLCSECDEDDDCRVGQTCVSFGMEPGVCFGEEPGSDCVADDDCPEGEYCTTVIDVPGLFSKNSCSECEADMGCEGEQLCAPTYDLDDADGYYSCVDPGSVPGDSGCNITGDGSECASGHCAPAGLMGIPVVAVCSPCTEAEDCGDGMTCQLPEIVIEDDALVLVSGACV